MEISFEGLIALIGAVAGATMWIVSAIYSVRNSIKDLAVSIRADIDKHDEKLASLDDEMDDVESRLSHLEQKH